MRRPRRNHSAKFKAQVALEAIRGETTIAEIAAYHEVHPTQVTSWKNEGWRSWWGFLAETVPIGTRGSVFASCTPRSVSSPWREIFWKVRSGNSPA